MENIDFLNKASTLWDQVRNKNRSCMYSYCSQKAIKSHVLQKNGILKQISENNHIIELKPANLFEIHDKGISNFKKVGVNNAYTFKGFCNQHDCEIFKPIEKNSKLNLQNPLQQALFSYRGLCQEIRRKEIAIEFNRQIVKIVPQDTKPMFETLNDGYIDGYRNLNYFRKELELALQNNKFNQFSFFTVKIPKIDLCISVSLNIGELSNPEKLPYAEWKNKQKIPFTTSFINVFPYKQDSYFIAGFHNKYPCHWTIEMVKKLRKFSHSKILKELSDLIVLRLEFWAMSPTLFSEIPNQSLKKYKQIFSDNIFNHSEKLKTNLNLFQ